MSGGNTATLLLAVGWSLMEAPDGTTVDEVCRRLSPGQTPTRELRKNVRGCLARLRQRGLARRDVPERTPGGREPDRWFSLR